MWAVSTMSYAVSLKEKSSEAMVSGRIVSCPNSLLELVSAHPDSLSALFRAGRPTDPAELGANPRGRLLALSVDSAFFLLRPLVQALSADGFPWKGKVFDVSTHSGGNVVLGQELARFHTEVGTSAIDGAPALILRYGEPSFHNRWPVRAMVDELRTVGDGIAIGPAFFSNKGVRHLLLWFGLERI